MIFVENAPRIPVTSSYTASEMRCANSRHWPSVMLYFLTSSCLSLGTSYISKPISQRPSSAACTVPITRYCTLRIRQSRKKTCWRLLGCESMFSASRGSNWPLRARSKLTMSFIPASVCRLPMTLNGVIAIRIGSSTPESMTIVSRVEALACKDTSAAMHARNINQNLRTKGLRNNLPEQIFRLKQ